MTHPDPLVTFGSEPASGSGSAPRSCFPWGFLAWLYFVVLWLTWTPVRDAVPELQLLPSHSGTVVLGNLLLFAPLAVVLAAYLAARARSQGREVGPRLVVGVAGTALLLSLIVELGQLRVPGRNVSPWDLAMNSGGAAGAAWLAARLVRAGVGARALGAAAGAVVFVGVVIFVTATGLAASRLLVIAEWNAEYPVVSADEPSGNRAHPGAVTEARICAGRENDEICVEPGAALEARETLVGAARDAQSVRLSATVASPTPPTGAPRIVTFSSDNLHRNASLHQEERDLVLRLRTPLGGANGTGLAFVLAEAVPDGASTRVFASFRPDRIVMTAETGTETIRGAFPIGMFSGWWLVRRSPERTMEARSLFRSMLVAAAAFSVPLGLGMVGALGWGPAALRLIAGALVPPMLLTVLASVLGIPLPWEEVIAAGGLGLLGAGMAWPNRELPGPRWGAGGRGSARRVGW